MKPVLACMTLLVVLVLGLLAYAVYDAQQYTVAAWESQSGYHGPVCLHVTVDRHCGNGAPYTPASVNAGESYGLWAGCFEYQDPYACEMLDD